MLCLVYPLIQVDAFASIRCKSKSKFLFVLNKKKTTTSMFSCVFFSEFLLFQQRELTMLIVWLFSTTVHKTPEATDHFILFELIS